MGSINVPPYLGILITITAIAQIINFAFYGENLVTEFQQIDDGNLVDNISQMLDAMGLFFTFLFFAIPGTPILVTIILTFMITIPWLIFIIIMVTSLIPFT